MCISIFWLSNLTHCQIKNLQSAYLLYLQDHIIKLSNGLTLLADRSNLTTENLIATAGQDRKIKITEAKGLMNEIIELSSPTYVNDLSFDDSSKILFAAGQDSKIGVWNLSKKKLICKFGAHSEPVIGNSTNIIYHYLKPFNVLLTLQIFKPIKTQKHRTK